MKLNLNFMSANTLLCTNLKSWLQMRRTNATAPTTCLTFYFYFYFFICISFLFHSYISTTFICHMRTHKHVYIMYGSMVGLKHLYSWWWSVGWSAIKLCLDNQKLFVCQWMHKKYDTVSNKIYYLYGKSS